MIIKKYSVASIHYTLTDDDKNQLDSSDEKNPLTYLHGAGGIIPGLETELTGKSVGDKFKVTVTPEEGYGLLNPELLQDMPLSAFEGIADLSEGMQLQAEDENGNSQMIVVRTIKNDVVTIDGNHPLAGQTLHFDVSVASIRAATPEELDHGHVH